MNVKLATSPEPVERQRHWAERDREIERRTKEVLAAKRRELGVDPDQLLRQANV